MVTLLGVTMTTACEDYESPKDKIANISELINKDIKDIVQQNEEVSDTIRKKDSTTVFLDEFENVLDEYKDKNTLRSEEVEAIQNLVRLASAEFEQTLSKHPELRDNSTLNEYLDSLKQKEDDLTSYLNDIKKLEEIDSDSEDVAFFSWMTTVSFLVLVAILIATIAHFRAKLKKVSQKQADIGSGKEKTKGKHAPTYNTEVQKNNPFQQLSQLVTEEAKNIRREIDKSKNDLSRQLSQLSQSQFTTVNSGYVPSGGTNGSQLNGGNAVQPLPNVPTDGSRLYAELIGEVQRSIRDIQENCSIIARLDVLQSFAQQASDRGYCRPVMDKSTALEIKAGRHPVIETLMSPGEEYVPNDISMDSRGDQIIILTGPNMAGKSALLRQTALIVLMAQCGSFVPAESARIGWFDKIFTRVGATDNISRGESTFMVEMLETSMIMHNLSARSLVLLDEIGRGTSTYDGMSIARALVEYIHTYGKGAKTLFATHYHELNDLEKQYPRVRNYHIAVKEEGRNVIFLRKLEPGGVAHSFGIHVARLAGMPREVIDSAERTLRELETREKHMGSMDVDEDGSLQLSLFQLDDPTLSSIRRELEDADLNNMTPLQAFDLLRKMKQEVGL